MTLAARQGDAVATGHGCDATTTLDSPSQGTVYIESQLACRLGDPTVTHQFPNPSAPPAYIPHVHTIGGSNGTVYIAGVKASRKGDSCDAGSITGSASKVHIE